MRDFLDSGILDAPLVALTLFAPIWLTLLLLALLK